MSYKPEPPSVRPPPPLRLPATTGLTATTPSSLYTPASVVKPVINGVGVVTVLGGSIMPPEVVRAMEEASRYFVPLPEMEKKVGARIAELLQAPAAMVTCGAASAISVGTGRLPVSRATRRSFARLPGRDAYQV